MSSSVAVKLRTPEIIDFIENMYMYNGSPLGKQSIIILGAPGIGKSEYHNKNTYWLHNDPANTEITGNTSFGSKEKI